MKKYYYGGLTFNFWRGPWGPTFKLWGGPGSRGPGPTFTPCHINDTQREIICFLLNSAQEFIEVQCWLLLTSSICLHNQLSFIHSISYISYNTKECRCVNKIFYKLDRKWMVSSFANFYGKICVGFVLTHENALF